MQFQSSNYICKYNEALFGDLYNYTVAVMYRILIRFYMGLLKLVLYELRNKYAFRSIKYCHCGDCHWIFFYVKCSLNIIHICQQLKEIKE